MDPTRGHQPDFSTFGLNNLASTSTQTLNDLFPLNGGFSSLLQNQQPSPSFPQQFAQSMQQPGFSNPWAQLAMQMNGQTSSPQTNSAHLQNSQPADPPMRYTPPSSTSTPAPTQQNPAPVNQAAWMNTMMPPQGFPAGISPMALNMSFLPQQLLHDAYAMSVPVGAADEPLLLTTLLNSRKKNESYKDALNSLHGKLGHSASLWKDYYLDHKERCDQWITQCLQKEKEDRAKAKAKTGKVSVKRSASSEADRVRLPSVKKPSPSHFKRESSPQPSSLLRMSISAPIIKRAQKKMKPSKSETPPIPMPLPSRRSTINSLTAPEPVFGGNLPAPNTEIKIPEPPSRAPSPPTNIVPHKGRGNKYTIEDREYFIKFLGWHLKQNPNLTRQDLCNMLAEDAPHHTSQSWASHWSNNHDVPDKILAAARGDEEPVYVTASSSHGHNPVRRKRTYKDLSTSEEEDGGTRDDDDSNAPDDDSSTSSNNLPLRVYTEKEMGQKGGAFTEADMYITAKWIASHPNWHNMNFRQRWEPIGVKYSQRSDKSWAEYYRRNEKPLLDMAKKIKAEQHKISQTQCAQPRFAGPSSSAIKRKLDPEDDEDEDDDDSGSVQRGKS